MKKTLQKIKNFSVFKVLLVSLLLFVSSNKVNAQFTATWPYTSGLTASVGGASSNNVTVSDAIYTSGAGGLFTGTITSSTGYLNGTGISGKAATACATTYNSVGATTPITPYLEYKITPKNGYSMSTNTFTFTVEHTINTVTNILVAAGYSIDGGNTFIGLTPTGTGSGNIPATGPTGSNFGTTSGSTAGTFTFSVPGANIDATKSLIIRIVGWRNNSSNSSSANLKISPPTISGNTAVSVSPIITTPVPTTLSNFNYYVSNGPSPSQSFSVAGTNLTNDLVVTPPSDYEISTNNSTFSNSAITLTPTSGTVASTIYTRLAAGKSAGSIASQNITITSNGATSQNVILSSGLVTKNYNYIGSGSLADVNNWGDTSNGTGNHPVDFISDYQTFTITNTTAVSMDTDWSVSGLQSKVVVGSSSTPGVALTIAATTNLTPSKMDLAGASSGTNKLIVQSTAFDNSTLGTLNPSSTIEFKVDNASIKTAFENNISISSGIFTTNSVTISGNLTISGSGTLNLNTGGAARTLTLNGNLVSSGTGGIKNSLILASNGTQNRFDILLTGTNKTITNTATVNDLSKTNLSITGSYALAGDFDYSSAGSARSITTTSTGSLSIGANTLKMGAANLIETTANTISDAVGSIINTTSTVTPIPSGRSWLGTIQYTASSTPAAQSVVTGTYNNLTIVNSAGATLTGATTVNGNLLVSTGTLNTGANSIVLGSNANATFGPTASLTISTGGTTNFNAIPVTLQSNATGTAAIVNNGTLNGATNVTVQRYLESTQRGWRMLGSPLTTSPALTSVATNSSLSNLSYGTNSSAITYGSTTNVWNNIQNGTDTWTGTSALGLFVRGAGSEGMGGVYSADPSSVTIALNGTLNTTAPAPVTIDAGKWYLVANPYSAPISMYSVLNASTGLQSSVAIYDPTLAASSVRVKAGGYTTIPVTATTAGAVGDVIIPVMGAVFVQASNVAATLNIPTTTIFTGTNTGTTIHTLKTTSPFSISNGSATTSNEQTKLTMHLESNGITADAIQFVFDEQSKTGSNDRFDFGKLQNTNLDFYSISSDNKNLAVDQRDLSSQSIPLGIKTEIQNRFKLVVDENTIPANKQLLLKDNLEHISKVLVKGGTYEFDVTTLNATKGNQRFELILRDDKSMVSNSEDNLVRWWPNPAQEVLNIENTVNNTQNVQVEILNMYGQKMNSANIPAGTTVNMEVQSWSPGLYFIKTTNGDTTKTNKVIIKALTK